MKMDFLLHLCNLSVAFSSVAIESVGKLGMMFAKETDVYSVRLSSGVEFLFL